jgi:hypothetical protein
VSWQKQGLLIEPPVQLPWVASHAAIPHAESLSDGRALIYFTTRDERRRSHVALAELAPGSWEPRVAPEPLLTPGPPGTFDDSGVMTSCLVRHDDIEYLYYQGWHLGVTVPFSVFVGCATRREGEEVFRRVSASPVLDRDEHDPFMCASPWVLVEDGCWRMWYVSNRGWENDEHGLRYRVHVRYAESSDGLGWQRDGRVCLDFEGPDEYAISRPCVVRDGALYRMWYSHRGRSYRIGYAESEDGLEWRRRDELAGIDVSDQGWDSEMVEYACILDRDGERTMLYNGNGYGETGIGRALLVDA